MLKTIGYLLALVSLVFSLTCEEWNWHKDYASSFYCIIYNSQTYMSEVHVPPNGDTPPTSDFWKQCTIIGDACVADSVINACKENVITFDTTKQSITITDTIHENFVINDTVLNPINVFDTVTSIIEFNITDTIKSSVVVLDTSRTQIILYDTTINPVTVYDTTMFFTLLYDTTVIPVTVHDSIKYFETIFKYDTTIIHDTIYYLDESEFSILDSVYINNRVFAVSLVESTSLYKSPILITKIDTNIFNVGSNDSITFNYTIMIYDKQGRYVNHVTGNDILFDGNFKISKLNLFESDQNGYLISENGKRLGTGAYIVKGSGTININGNKAKTFIYNSLEGYRRR